MESKTPNGDGDGDGNEIDATYYGEFVCCVCLDLLYKPVVLACGHTSCFWCVLKAMHPWHESHCPVCRQPYNHFPSICELLHFVLMKLYPSTYKRRESQVTEEEKEYGHASAQISDQSALSQCNEKLNNPIISQHSNTNLQTDTCSQTSCPPEEDPSKFVDVCKSTARDLCCKTNTASVSTGTSRDAGNSVIQETNVVENNRRCGTTKNISCADLLCLACKKLLFQPSVLNCGHVYCRPCIISQQDEVIRCIVCQSLHPNGLPNICLILEHFLEEQFPEVYAQRRGSTQSPRFAVQSPPDPKIDYLSGWIGCGPKVHIGVGCDYCGMQPIIGERYKCKDCVEAIGFDLCEQCYNSPSKLPSRFNQQHRPEHVFEVVQPNNIHVLSSLEAEDDHSNVASQDHEDAPPSIE